MQTEQARLNMIEQQIRPWNVVDDDVLAVMQQIPREFFVPEKYHDLAFADTEIPLDHGQHMMAPKIEAHMLQSLAIKPGDKVLEIGTGSGYITACLAWLSGDVTSIELHADLAENAAKHIAAIGTEAKIVTDDAFELNTSERYDVIAITGSLPVRTDFFENLLKDGGRLFQVIGEGASATAELVTRVDGDLIKRKSLFETSLAPLDNAPKKESFSF